MSANFNLQLLSLIALAGAFLITITTTVPPASGAKDNGELLNRASAALDDELYDVAEQNIRQYLNLSGTANQPDTELVIMLAKALHGQKRYAEMLNLLNQNKQNAQGTPLADKFAYWLALAFYENGLLPQVLEETASFEKKYPDSASSPDITRVRIKALLKTGHEPEAINALQRLIKENTNSSESVYDRLALGRILADAGKTGEACAILEKLLDNPPESSIGQKTRGILGRVYINEKQFKKARSIYETLFNQKNIPAEYRLQTIESLAEIAAAQTNYMEALALIEKGYAHMPEPWQRNKLSLHKGILLLKMKKIDEGIRLIHNYVSTQTNITTAAEVQLELAQTLLGNRLNETALVEFQNFVEAFNSQTNIAEAYKGKGTALLNLARCHEAAAAFAKAEELTKSPAEKNQYRYLAADSLFAAGQYEKAAEIYTQVAGSTADYQLDRMALFQTAECLLQTENPIQSEAVFWKIYEDDPADSLGPRSLLRLADIFMQRSEFRAAETIYNWVKEDYGAPWNAWAIYGLGMIAYRSARFSEALNYFEQAMKSANDEEVAATAAYMSAWALFMMNKIDESCRRFSSVLNSSGGSSKAPEALFWLGEFDYNLGRSDSAEASFRRLADKYPRSVKADHALFWAGRAALNQSEFRRARDYFSALIKRYPSSQKRPAARYFQGVALCELGQFDAAILIFAEIIKQNPEHLLMESAAFKRADCQFILGSGEPKRYEEAINSYQLILDLPERTLASRLQAKYKIGRCLEKLGKTNDAFSQYLQVVYLYLQNDEQNPACNLWFARAAFNAAGIMEEKQSWHKAANIYERVVEADIPASRDAQERIDKLRTEHWLSFY